jgi:hypothetical protein
MSARLNLKIIWEKARTASRRVYWETNFDFDVREIEVGKLRRKLRTLVSRKEGPRDIAVANLYTGLALQT